MKSLFHCLSLLVIVSLAMPGFAQAGEQKQSLLTAQEIERASRDALYLLIVPTKGKLARGTGFLVSTDPPLLVTTAHTMWDYQPPVKIWVGQNNTGRVADVRRVHIAREYVHDQSSRSPDVALLELDLNQEDPPKPLTLKGLDDSTDLRAADVVVMGFPGYSCESPEKQIHPETVIRKGIVSSVEDYSDTQERSPIEERPLITLSFDIARGDSGAPVIDATGQVIGVVKGYHGYFNRETLDTEEEVWTSERVSYAVHVRMVWELLELHYPKVAKRLKE